MPDGAPGYGKSLRDRSAAAALQRYIRPTVGSGVTEQGPPEPAPDGVVCATEHERLWLCHHQHRDAL